MQKEAGCEKHRRRKPERLSNGSCGRETGEGQHGAEVSVLSGRNNAGVTNESKILQKN